MMQTNKTSRHYDRWSSFYDNTFAPMVERRIRHGIAEMHLRGGDRVLDLGVGTGNSLEYFPKNVQVVGMDISEGMLRRAHRKTQKNGLHNIRLVQGDAMSPPFPENSFDHILLTHVISVVSDPDSLLRHCERLLRPGGSIVIVNHFKSRRKPLAAVQKAINPVCKKLGWRTDLPLQSLIGPSPLRIVRTFKLTTFDVWRIVVLQAERDPVTAKHVRSGLEPAVPEIHTHQPGQSQPANV